MSEGLYAAHDGIVFSFGCLAFGRESGLAVWPGLDARHGRVNGIGQISVKGPV